MADFTWWSVVPSTIGGLIGGTFAVVGMVVAGRREGNKVIEDRQREALRAARQCLLAVEDLYATDHDPDDSRSLTIAGHEKQQRLLRELRTYVAAIPQDEVRSPLERVGRMIGHIGISTFEGDRDPYSTYRICAYGNEVISSYLRDGRLPPHPDFVSSYLAAIDEYGAIAMEQHHQPAREEPQG